jgi:mono/diheme cytochrome c family protein
MRKLGRIFIRLLLVLIVLLLSAAALVYFTSERALNKRYDVHVKPIAVPTDQASVARGRELVEHRYVCAECHGPDYGGKPVFDAGPMVARIVAANITPGAGGVGRHYTDVDWIRALRHGVAPDGRPLLVMPSHHIGKSTEQDLGAAIAYLKTLPSVDREIPPPSLGPIGRVLLLQDTAELLPATVIDHTQGSPTETPLTQGQRGEQLVTLAGCVGCHRADLTGGGGPPPGSSNITPLGLEGWTREDFVRTLRTGVTPDGRRLAEVMPRAYGKMPEDELDALWTYLRTVPAKGDLSVRQQAAHLAARAQTRPQAQAQ